METLLLIIILLFAISISFLIYIIILIKDQASVLLQAQSDDYKNIMTVLTEMRLFIKNNIDITNEHIVNKIDVEHVDISDKIYEIKKKLIAVSEYAQSSFSYIESKDIERNNMILKKFDDLHKNIIEHQEIAGKLLVSTTSRDMLSKEYLKELSERTDSLKKTTEMIYKDFDLLLELLKAGLMSDLIRDLKEKINKGKHSQ